VLSIEPKRLDISCLRTDSQLVNTPLPLINEKLYQRGTNTSPMEFRRDPDKINYRTWVIVYPGFNNSQEASN
jgi:hypothetical protein